MQNSGYLHFLLLANQNKYANELFNMRIRWRQTTWVTLVPTTTNIPSFMKISHCVLVKVYLFCWRATIHEFTSSIHPCRQRDNCRNLSGPSSIAGCPQNQDKKQKENKNNKQTRQQQQQRRQQQQQHLWAWLINLKSPLKIYITSNQCLLKWMDSKL